jgi:hypothetical protein
MEAKTDYGPEPIRKDTGILLFLVAACPFGLLMWSGLAIVIQWTVLAAWAALVGLVAVANPIVTATDPALPSLAPVPDTVFHSSPAASSVLKLPAPGRVPPG